MLQVSETAVAVLEEARTAQELPDTFGVRISGQPTDAGQMEVTVGFAEQPADGDEVTEQAGTQIFIAPEVAEPLAEAKLDLEPTPEGPQLVIKPQ
jgi:Fe-S cluster assembly iron-binding protein IscA